MTVRKTYDGPYFKALNDSTGEFEAIVSVFGNVDLQGDRVVKGAFAKSLDHWRKQGDPIPVIWSHDWADPFAHIGVVYPTDAYEIASEDAKSLGEIEGGLYVKGRLDVQKPFARQVYDLLKERRVREWSFAYDVVEDAPSEIKGATDLMEVNLWEVGPTLKGANPTTATIGVKSVLEEAAALDRGLKKITRALNVDVEVGMKMLKDYVAEDLKELSREEVEELIDGTKEPELKWDGAAAMGKCSSAGDFRSIAFERSNGSDPNTAAHWCLPHHASPHGPADAGGVQAAKGRANQVSDLKPSLESVMNHLDRHSGGKQHDAEDNWIEDAEEKTADAAEEKAELKPWRVEKRGDQWCVVKESDGDVEGCHDTEEDAMAQMRALYAADNGKSEGTNGVTTVTTATPFTTSTTSTTASIVFTNNVPITSAEELKAVIAKAVDDYFRKNGDVEAVEQDAEAERAKAELEEYQRKIALLGDL